MFHEAPTGQAVSTTIPAFQGFADPLDSASQAGITALMFTIQVSDGYIAMIKRSTTSAGSRSGIGLPACFSIR